MLNAKDFSLPINQIKNQCPDLEQWLNSEDKIDLGNSKALFQYNKCLFKILDNIELDLSIDVGINTNLIPTAGLRRAIVSAVLSETHPQKIIEIGTGATAIMALLFAKNNVQVIATEINPDSLQSAHKQVLINKFEERIKLLKSDGGILDYLQKYFPVDCVVSLPPYYADETKSLPRSKKGFRGVDSELYSFGQDIDFSVQLLQEWSTCNSSNFLCTLWKNHSSLEKAIVLMNELNLTHKSIEITAGTRKRYLTITQRST